MKAVKANKEYTIAEQEQKRYIADGYDIVDDKGNVIAYGRGKTEKQETVDLTAMTVEELTAFAKDKGIDIGQATSQEGIIKKIRAALEA